MPQGLPRKLRRLFVLQAVLAIVAVVTCMYVATVFARGQIASDWMRTEAQRFWHERARDPTYAPPWTQSVNSYFVADGVDALALGVPRAFVEAGPGLHRLRGSGPSQRLLVEDAQGGRLYLRVTFMLMDRVGVWSLGIAALLSLLAIATVSWLSYRIARRLVLPLTVMAGEVARWDPRTPDLDAIAPAGLPGEVGTEVRLLGGAIRGLAERTQSFIRRERDFTREASHELRTPLTVVRVATDMLRRDPELPTRMHRSLDRVHVAARDMESVIDALLILAREDEPVQTEEFDLLDVAVEAARVGEAMLEELGNAEAVDVRLVEQAAPVLHGSRRAMTVILEQLVRNACTFTAAGSIEVLVGADRVEVRDTGVGMDRDVLERVFEPFYRADQYVGGRGLGLAVVRRLAARFNWTVAIDSAPGRGTLVTLRFARAD
ncbi:MULTISPECIES: HAMP domain-containing sensor histidine kinase [unclassified Luteimonas]|uniref:sensor histidine kinase n=1 Tax=unclassified Luteimonas TaxID=2629088 RepID=UPI0018F07B97|nr:MULTISPECIES: HAMP domain-containing sensor histidine kinase [unclassified Luteimonas]MBJ6980133.1 HAMP domain-containing histidine kinase [Luteimonas sp. MC1895]MBJ6985388.1 HAMP domain-containing histidine kinase [Luteimonas sp. MC1750]QQO05353.1 HAMP domain-containing histidine kinase [Luteimonas sp. MC1750]